MFEGPALFGRKDVAGIRRRKKAKDLGLVSHEGDGGRIARSAGRRRALLEAFDRRAGGDHDPAAGSDHHAGT